MNNIISEAEFYNMYDKSIYDQNYFKVHEIKKYLQDTDYIVIKIYETAIQGGSIIEMLKEYKDILSKRAESRKEINKLEQALKTEQNNNETTE